MRDGVLADDDVAVGEAGGDVVREVGVYGRDDGDVLGDRAYQAQEVDGGFEGAGEEPGAGEEKIAY